MRGGLWAVALAALLSSAPVTAGPPSAWRSGLELRPVFEQVVKRRLAVPEEERAAYAQRLDAAFAQASVAVDRPQYVLLVDRSPQVQVAFVFWRDAPGGWHLIGAAPASTGSRGGFEHFITPLGVFPHATANLDFRAEGTRNELGVRGYGTKGMRVYDFGWALAERTWGSGGASLMRLQVHATDPDLLEKRLGRPASKGCIRILADLNRLLDRFGLLDADYEAELAQGRTFWVLPADRTPTPWSGRYLVVVDSARSARPPWTAPVRPPGRQIPAAPSAGRSRPRAARRAPLRPRRRPHRGTGPQVAQFQATDRAVPHSHTLEVRFESGVPDAPQADARCRAAVAHDLDAQGVRHTRCALSTQTPLRDARSGKLRRVRRDTV